MADLSDPKDVSKLSREAAREERERGQMLKAIMDLQQGREWMHKLLARCHPWHNPFSTDPLRTAFACGEMNIGQWLMADLDSTCPELYQLMLKEAGEKDATRRALDDNATDAAGDTGPS